MYCRRCTLEVTGACSARLLWRSTEAADLQNVVAMGVHPKNSCAPDGAQVRKEGKKEEGKNIVMSSSAGPYVMYRQHASNITRKSLKYASSMVALFCTHLHCSSQHSNGKDITLCIPV